MAKNSPSPPLPWSVCPTLLHCWWAVSGTLSGGRSGEGLFPGSQWEACANSTGGPAGAGLGGTGRGQEPASQAAQLLVSSIQHWDGTPGSPPSLCCRHWPGLRQGQKDRRARGRDPGRKWAMMHLQGRFPAPAPSSCSFRKPGGARDHPEGPSPPAWAEVAPLSGGLLQCWWPWRPPLLAFGLGGSSQTRPAPPGPPSLTHWGHLEISWRSPLPSIWQSLGLRREGRAPPPPPPGAGGLGRGVRAGGEASGRAEARAARLSRSGPSRSGSSGEKKRERAGAERARCRLAAATLPASKRAAPCAE